MLLPTVGYSTLSEARGLGTAVMRRKEEGEESRAEFTEAVSRLLQLSELRGRLTSAASFSGQGSSG